MKKTETENLDW